MASRPPTAAEMLLQQAQSNKTPAQVLLDLARRPAEEQALTTPIALPPDPQRADVPLSLRGRGRFPGALPQRFSEQERATAEAGVDIFTGAPTGRVTAGFAGNEAIAAEFFRKELTDFYGEPVRLRKGPESGALEFFNPETRRFTTVDEATFTSRDLNDFLSDALPLAGAGIGEAFGGPVGAAAGAGVGEALNQGIASILGVSSGVEDVTSEVLSEAGAAGAGSAVFRTAAKAQRGIRDFFSPKPIEADIAEGALDSLRTNQAIADEISERSGERFQPLTGQLSGDQTLLGVQNQLASAPGTAVAVRQQLEANDSALGAFFDATTVQGAVQTESGRIAQLSARQRTRRFLDQGEEIARRSLDDLENLIDSLPREGADTGGRRIRGLIVEERRQIKQLEDDAYAAARDAYGFDELTSRSDIQIPISPELRKTMGALKADSRNALFAEQAAGKSILTPESLTNADNMDLHQVEEAIRFLRRRQRLDAKNEVAGTPTGVDVTRVLQSLTNARSQFLSDSNPGVLAAIETAEQLSKERARTFDRSILRSILKKDESGDFVLRDREVISRTIASGDRDATQHLMNILSENPAGQQELQKTMLALYRKEVVLDGLPNLALHRKFVERHGDAAEIIFPKNAGTINAFGKTIDTAEDVIARTENFKKLVSKTFAGRLQDVAPENVISDMFLKKFTVKDAGRFRSLAQAGGFLPQYERALGDEIKRRVFSGKDLSPTKLQGMLDKDGEMISGLLGPQYVMDLRTLLKGLELSKIKPPSIAKEPRTSLLDGIRAITLPPLSVRGRVGTFGLNIRQEALKRALFNAISDPKGLRAIVISRNRDLRDQRVVGLLGALGGASLEPEGELQPGPIFQPEAEAIPPAQNAPPSAPTEATSELPLPSLLTQVGEPTFPAR